VGFVENFFDFGDHGVSFSGLLRQSERVKTRILPQSAYAHQRCCTSPCA
jgi:hypothetical protein